MAQSFYIDMEEKRKIRNYDLLSNYNWFIPNPWEIFAILFLLLAGALLGNAVSAVMMLAMQTNSMDILTLISYPIMFIPPMIYASFRSRRNVMFDDGTAIDSNSHFGKPGFAGCAGLAMLATLALAFLMDAVNSLMPPMPEWLESMLKGMTQGNVVINFVCVSLFAPFFEEWLCRGIVLRGLLNWRRTDADKGNGGYGMRSPASAIVLSALFFAFIHMNPWQAVPAFGLGCLFGYVYYRTGSLKLTMLMHFTNNTFALIAGNIDSLKDVENWLDILPVWQYVATAVICIAYMYLFIKTFNKIRLNSRRGNCDVIKIM